MQFTVKHPNGETTTTECHAPYRSEGNVLTIKRERIMPHIAASLVPDAWRVTGVVYEGTLRVDLGEPPELADQPRGQFIVRDDTGAKCTVYAVLKMTHNTSKSTA